MKFGEKLRKYRTERRMSQDELASILETSKQVISRYESGQRSPKIGVVQEYAQKLNLPILYLIDDQIDSIPEDIPFDQYDNIIPLPKMRRIPLLGDIACGEPILAVENLDGNVEIPDNIDADFALRCKGDSMINARIFNGDIVYIRQQPTVENGEIAAVLIGSEATLKKVYMTENAITLNPANDAYQPLVFVGEEINTVKILGKAVAFTSTIR